MELGYLNQTIVARYWDRSESGTCFLIYKMRIIIPTPQCWVWTEQTLSFLMADTKGNTGHKVSKLEYGLLYNLQLPRNAL